VDRIFFNSGPIERSIATHLLFLLLAMFIVWNPFFRSSLNSMMIQPIDLSVRSAEKKQLHSQTHLQLAQKVPAQVQSSLAISSTIQNAQTQPAAFSSEQQMIQLSARQLYLNRIRAKIESQKIYPLWARQRRIEGKSEVSFRVDRNGLISALRLVCSSQNELLDDASLNLIRSIQSFDPFPIELTVDHLEVVVPVVYRLMENGA
jgi:TonB family protein